MSKQNELAQLADVVTVDGSSVGIGTSSPSAKLDVNGGTTYPAFKTSRDGGSAASQGYTTFGHSAVGYSGGTGADTYIVSEHGYGFAVNGGTTALAITDTGNIGIGTSSVNAKLDVRGTGVVDVGIGSTSAGGAYLYLDGDSNGDFSGSDYCYIGHDSSGQLTISQDSPSGSNTMIFSTAATERMRLDSDGLKFNGDTAAANALNDYEEGTWTPVDGSGQVTILGATGVYTKVGRQVTVLAAFTYPSTSQTNYAIVAGLPFTVSNSTDAMYASGSVQTSYISSTNRHLTPLAYNNTSTFYFYDSELPLTNAAFSTRNFRVNITYFTDQ